MSLQGNQVTLYTHVSPHSNRILIKTYWVIFFFLWTRIPHLHFQILQKRKVLNNGQEFVLIFTQYNVRVKLSKLTFEWVITKHGFCEAMLTKMNQLTKWMFVKKNKNKLWKNSTKASWYPPEYIGQMYRWTTQKHEKKKTIKKSSLSLFFPQWHRTRFKSAGDQLSRKAAFRIEKSNPISHLSKWLNCTNTSAFIFTVHPHVTVCFSFSLCPIKFSTKYLPVAYTACVGW